ncbi:hypothetical protein [Bosea sp. (in: a-proteobacteria)]|uniref:hypothetical protein n=1 Tax=Bosea sp. (in: a-proteobacteria) TaxID=1871050 RepID=UPI002733950D|nr:hypothetical protein [Bosea sp. (in: a-proteobacteria)]MDP3408378.1 hypothetical protein [Bosea sp. (in: a-proteobacteria)]
MSATDEPGSPGSPRDMTGESPSDGPAAGIDMVAHVALERASFPPNRPALAFVQGRRFVARLPALRQSLASAVMLGLRFVQARMISVWGLLVAAYFCPPHIFAAFAVFSAAAAFVSIPALMRLEAVFFRSGDGRELALAFRLALASGAAFLGLVAVVLIGLAATGWIAPAVALVFFLSLAARAVLRLLWAEATAEGDFRAIGNSNLMQALVQPCLMLLLIGLFGPKALALFLADALGHWAAAIHVMIRRRENIFALARPRLWSLRALAWGAKRWSDAPRILLPAALLSFAFTAAPLMALPYATDPLLAAQVALAMRLLDMPTQMFGMVSGPLLMNGLRRQSGQRRQVWVRWTTLALIAGTIGVYGPIALGTSHFDDLFDGSRWSGVGHVIAIMTMFYAGIALFNPLHDIAALARTTGWQLAAHAIALFAIVATILWFGELSRDLLYAVGAISLARAAAHVLFAWSGQAHRHRGGADVAGARAAAS